MNYYTRGFLFIVITALLSFKVYSAQPDWGAYDNLLKRYVAKREVNNISLNYVDYQGLFKDPLFFEVVEMVEGFPTDTLNSEQDRLAFYINAYNIFAMKVVNDHWPLESIKDAGSWISPVWKKKAGHLNGREISLGEIEHEILRPMGEPRIHFAIVCASLSCPDLRAEAFQVNLLEMQLNDQVVAFLSNEAKGLKVVGETANVSKIFDWFEDDFDAQGGVKSFINKYVNNPALRSVEADLPYDWSLNGQ